MQSSPLIDYQHQPDNSFTLEEKLVTLETSNEHQYIDKRSHQMINMHKIKGIWNDFKFLLTTLWEDIKNLFRPTKEKNFSYDLGNAIKMDDLDNTPDADTSNTVFIIPGLKSTGTWGHLARKIFEKESGIEARVLKIPKQGNQKVKTSSDFILKMISKYCTKNPNKPIAIMGASLGGRLAHKIEASLRISHPNTPVMVYSIAPAFASTYATRMNTSIPALARLAIYPDLLNAFSVGSEETKKLVASENGTLNNTVRNIVVVQASEDPLIDGAKAFPNLTAQLNLTYTKKVAYGFRHLGVVSGVTNDAVTEIRSFFKALKSSLL